SCQLKLLRRLLELVTGELVLIELPQEIERGLLLLLPLFLGPIKIIDWLALRLEPCALIDAGQNAGAPVLRIALGQAPPERIGHGDERGKAQAFAPQTIGDP